MNLPALTNFPTLHAVCKAIDKAGEERPLRIRRAGWDDPLFWIYYERGLWYLEAASGATLAENDAMEEADFLAQDWTTLTPACLTAGGNDCATTTEFFVQGFFYDEVVREEPGYDSPNAGPCGDVCALPELPASLDPATANESTFANSDSSSSSGSGTSGGADGSSARSGFGGGGSSSGSRARKRRRKKIPVSAVLTLSEPTTDIPACIPRLADGDGRLCTLPANPYAYDITDATVSLTDAANADDIWFVRVFFLNHLVFDGTLKHGETKDVTINKSGFLRWGHSHGLRAVGWFQGRPDIHAQRLITMAEPCAAAANCGLPAPTFNVVDNEFEAGFAPFAGEYYDSGETVSGNPVWTNGTTYAYNADADWTADYVLFYTDLADVGVGSAEDYNATQLGDNADVYGAVSFALVGNLEAV